MLTSANTVGPSSIHGPAKRAVTQFWWGHPVSGMQCEENFTALDLFGYFLFLSVQLKLVFLLPMAKTEGCLEMLWLHFSRFGFPLKKTDLIFLKAHKTSWAETWQLKFQPEECLELMVYAKDADRCCPASGRRSGEGVPGDRPCGCFVNAKFLLLNNFTLSETLTATILKF